MRDLTMPTYGRNPGKDLLPRDCEVCGSRYDPYRASQTTCSLACYKRSPRVRAREATYKARPEARDRKNAARRGRPDVTEHNRRSALRKYGLTVEQHDAMLKQQLGRCAICGCPPDPNGVRASSRLHVDHDHATGRVRGLLCNRCNRGVGYFLDDPDALRAAATYIETYREDPPP